MEDTGKDKMEELLRTYETLCRKGTEANAKSLEVRCSPLMQSARRFCDNQDEKPASKKKDNLFSQFNMLPERQSKINQIVSRMDGEESEVYCICRSTDSTSFMICCDNCEEWYHGSCIGVDRKSAKNIRNYYCEICREKDPSLNIRYKTKFKKHEPSDADNSLSKSSKSKSSSKTRRCGDCAACNRKQDCGRCTNCKDMKKFGGSNKHGLKCRLRQCTNFLDMSRVPDPIDFNDPKRLEQEEDPDYDEDEFLDFLSALPENKGKKFVRHNSSSSGGASKRKSSKIAEKDVKKHKRPYKRREKSPVAMETTTTPVPTRARGRPRKNSFAIAGEYESRSTQERSKEDPCQCLGPECVQMSRRGSKYCSDACGKKLARRRILEILPQRIQQWQASTCMADEANKRELENIRSQQLDSRQKLGELDHRHRELDSLIECSKNATVQMSDEEAEEEEEVESHVYCVTCGHEVNQKTALRHMEKCFNKYESQTSFGSIYKTRIEGTSMFCDYYNSQQQTYCKRLKVLCPEHSKDPKVGPDEICGFPVVENVFKSTGEFCRALKRKCNKHHSWEKLRRAEIDMERVRQWMRLDELFEQERAIRMSMANRAGVLGLMLHQTIDHDPTQPMMPKETAVTS